MKVIWDLQHTTGVTKDYHEQFVHKERTFAKVNLHVKKSEKFCIKSERQLILRFTTNNHSDKSFLLPPKLCPQEVNCLPQGILSNFYQESIHIWQMGIFEGLFHSIIADPWVIAIHQRLFNEVFNFCLLQMSAEKLNTFYWISWYLEK